MASPVALVYCLEECGGLPHGTCDVPRARMKRPVMLQYKHHELDNPSWLWDNERRVSIPA